MLYPTKDMITVTLLEIQMMKPTNYYLDNKKQLTILFFSQNASFII